MTSKRTTHMLSLHFPDIRVLRYAYMPFLIHGGLFIPFALLPPETERYQRSIRLNDYLCLLVQLPEETEGHCCLCRAVWLASHARHPGICAGVGFEFASDATALRTLIERKLLGHESSISATL